MHRLAGLSLLLATGALAQGKPGIELIGGYADRTSYLPGETVRLHVSSPDGGYRVDVARYGGFDDVNAAPPVLLGFDGGMPGARPIDVGSYVEVDPFPSASNATGISLEAWIYPRRVLGTLAPGGTILSRGSTDAGISVGLTLGPDSRVGFYLSDATAFDVNRILWSTATAPFEAWTHIVATWDYATKTLYLNGTAAGTQSYGGGVLGASEAIRIGGYSAGTTVEGHFDGKVDSIAAYSRPLPQVEALARYNAGRSQANPLLGAAAYFQLDFNEAGDLSTLTDSASRVTARIRNHATRGVRGPDGVGLALKLGSDDFGDVGWPVTDSFVIPMSWKSGFYAARLVELGSSPKMSYVPFVVKPAAPAASLAVIAASNTWAAYNPWPGDYVSYGTGFYNARLDGTLSYFAPLLRPNMVSSPFATFLPLTPPYAHLVRAERYLWSWLEKQEIAYDLYSDEDLHAGAVPRTYRAWAIAGHSEYWTTPMRDRALAYLASGGNLLNLSGNTAFWRTSYDPQTRILETRKWLGPTGAAALASDGGAVMLSTPPGERQHAQTGEAAGMMRMVLDGGEFGVLGVGSLGMVHNEVGVYEVLDTNHPVFRGTGIDAGDRLGGAGQNGGGVVGHEFDAWIAPWGPPNVRIFAEGRFGPGADCHAGQWRDGGLEMVSCTRGGHIAWWDNPGGGAVFSVASIGAAGGLATDPKLSALVRNAIELFIRPPDAGMDAGVDAGTGGDAGSAGDGGMGPASKSSDAGAGNPSPPPTACGCGAAPSFVGVLALLLVPLWRRRARWYQP